MIRKTIATRWLYKISNVTDRVIHSILDRNSDAICTKHRISVQHNEKMIGCHISISAIVIIVQQVFVDDIKVCAFNLGQVGNIQFVIHDYLAQVGQRDTSSAQISFSNTFAVRDTCSEYVLGLWKQKPTSRVVVRLIQKIQQHFHIQHHLLKRTSRSRRTFGCH